MSDGEYGLKLDNFWPISMGIEPLVAEVNQHLERIAIWVLGKNWPSVSRLRFSPPTIRPITDNTIRQLEHSLGKIVAIILTIETGETGAFEADTELPNTSPKSLKNTLVQSRRS